MIQAELFPVFAAPMPAGPRAASPPPLPKSLPGPVSAPIPGMPSVIERLAAVSSRPRYAFMVLNLIARAAGGGGRAGPYVAEDGQQVRLRDWLCDALSPMAGRDPRRIALAARVRADLEGEGALPDDPVAAARLVDEAVRGRMRASGRCNVSRAVSELVRAGLVRRHYQGWRVDHHNRGAQREAVYTLTAEALAAVGRR